MDKPKGALAYLRRRVIRHTSFYISWQERRDRRCEPLARQRDDLYDRLSRIHAAAVSDADLAKLPALRDFFIRESSVADLPGAIIGLVPEEETP